MWDEITYPFPNFTRYKHIHNRQTSYIVRTLLDNRCSSVIACPLCSNYRYIFILDDRPHSRQVTGARYTEVAARQSSMLLKASNGQQVSGLDDKRFPRFKRNVLHLWTAIIRHYLNDITHQQVISLISDQNLQVF